MIAIRLYLQMKILSFLMIEDFIFNKKNKTDLNQIKVLFHFSINLLTILITDLTQTYQILLILRIQTKNYRILKYLIIMMSSHSQFKSVFKILKRLLLMIYYKISASQIKKKVEIQSQKNLSFMKMRLNLMKSIIKIRLKIKDLIITIKSSTSKSLTNP